MTPQKENKVNKIHVRRGDMVTVRSGKEKGKRGKILKIEKEKNRAIVERVNLIKRHQRASGASRQGGIVEKEGPLNISNLQVVCPKCDQASRIGHTKLEDGRSVRSCRKCGEFLDKV